MKQKALLIAIIGLPGIGKSTLAKALASVQKCICVNSDEIRASLFHRPSYSVQEHAIVFKKVEQNVRNALLEGNIVVYDANLTRLQHRENVREIARTCSCNAYFIYLNCPPDVALTRIHERNEATSSLGLKGPILTDSVFWNMVKDFEIPAKWEYQIEFDCKSSPSENAIAVTKALGLSAEAPNNASAADV